MGQELSILTLRAGLARTHLLDFGGGETSEGRFPHPPLPKQQQTALAQGLLVPREPTYWTLLHSV